ncbi:hypothetical protein CMO92_00465 [Candidatus Woesearchaeota archaeon]|nr:hypothetical protein [Candidatus Woesearchaeota archaeon]
MFRGKKGQEQGILRIFFEIGAVVLIFLAMGGYMKGQIEDTTYWRTYYAKDLAYQLGLMEAAQGDFSTEYGFTGTNHFFRVDFEPGVVTLIDSSFHSKTERSQVYYPHNKDFTVENISMTPIYFQMQKIADSISFTFEEKGEEGCPGLRLDQEMKVHIGKDLDLKNEATIAEQYLQRTDHETRNMVAGSDLAAYLDYSEEEGITVLYTKKNPIPSQVLACLLALELREIDEEYFEEIYVGELRPGEDEMKNVYANDKISIYVELGTQEEYDALNSSKRDAVGKAVAEAVKIFTKRD